MLRVDTTISQYRALYEQCRAALDSENDVTGAALLAERAATYARMILELKERRALRAPTRR